RFTKRIGLVRVSHEQIGCVAEWLEHHNESVWFEDFGASSQCVDNIRCLDAHWKVAFEKSWNDGHPFRVYPLCCLDAFPAGLDEVVFELLFTCGQRNLPV